MPKTEMANQALEPEDVAKAQAEALAADAADAPSPKRRAKALKYTGDGSQFLYGVPARDLDEADITALNDYQYADITAVPPGAKRPLYEAKKGGDS